MSLSPTKPRPRGTLKAAVLRLVDVVGGVVRASELLGRGKSQVYRYTDDAEPDEITARQVLVLEAAARVPAVTEFLAAEQGFVLLPIASGGEDENLALDYVVIAQTAQGAFAGFARAIADDGQVDQVEAGALIADLDMVIGAALTARRHLKALLREAGR
ncbi:MAG: hypothetical protein ACRC67_18175 [Inquilinus sp.]|uniref:hypothetical protein n=1 Tax=Inquilinus sp. TaxID=1932117 RepID=UPI003F3064D3